MPTSSYYRTITTLLFIKPPKRKRRKVLKQLNVGDFQMPLEQWLVISYLLWCSFSSLMFSWELDFVILLLLSRYLFCCSYSHNVAPKGKFIAFVSTEAETDHPGTELKGRNWPSRACWWDILWYLWQIRTSQWTNLGQLLYINCKLISTILHCSFY